MESFLQGYFYFSGIALPETTGNPQVVSRNSITNK